MNSFFHQLRTLTLGAAHDLLDKAVDMNSPSMLRQYVRDLETAIGQMQSEAATQKGQLLTLERQKRDLADAIERDKKVVAQLLASTNPNAPTLARSRGAVVLQNQTRFASIDADIANQQAVADKIEMTVGNLQVKHDLMASRVQELERLDHDSHAKERAAAALKAASSLAGGPANTSIDNLEERMRARNDVATAQFDQSMGTFPQEVDPDSSDLDALLASLAPSPAAQ